MKITAEQDIKLQLVLLAEYLQCKELSDAQVKLYAAEMTEMGPEGLSRAIALLKEDPEVWAGRMPLPAKLKSYLRGDVNTIASESARKILSMNSASEIYQYLNHQELQVAKEYGIKAIVERSADQSPTIFAQLRDSLKARLKVEREGSVKLGLSRTSDLIGIGSATDQGDPGEDGEGRELETGSSPPL